VLKNVSEILSENVSSGISISAVFNSPLIIPQNRQTENLEAHAYSAFVHLALREKYFAALGSDSLAALSKLFIKYI
jgi:hypothetical protein